MVDDFMRAIAADDRRLLDAIIEGDGGACWALWQRHAGHLFAMCFVEMRGHRADAEDALAQSMMKAIAKLPLFAARIMSARAWLRGLTRNVCKDIQRERERARRIAEEACVANCLGCPVESEREGWWDGGTCDPMALVQRLPERLREVFTLRVLEQMRYRDIAAQLQLTCETARKRVQLARKLVQSWRDGKTTNAAPPPAVRRPVNRSAARERRAFPRVVRVRLSSGREAEVEILLDHRPVRERQKIATLRAYVARHPGGWKKRLALADLLYQTGAWVEAADGYRHVLRKRPWLTSVSTRLAEIGSKLEIFT